MAGRLDRSHAAFRSAPKAPIGLLAVAVLLPACAQEPRLSAGPEAAERSDVSASRGLVYVVADSQNFRRTDIWRARLSDGAVQPFIETADRSETEPVWSEPASALAFEVRSPARLRSPGRLMLWRAGSESELPGERFWGDLPATWAPLDVRLAYAVRSLQPAEGGDPVRDGITAVDVETGEQAILADGGRGDRYVQPAFSPDGRRLVAVYRTRRPLASRLVLLDREKAPQILTGLEYRASRPSISRDGQYIFFARRPRRTDPRDVMRMRSDGSALQRVASKPGSDDSAPAASPRRDEIAFLSNRDGKVDVFLVGTAGGQPRNLTAPLDLSVRTLRWSPDGEYIALMAHPYDAPGPERIRARPGPAGGQILVIDREGHLIFQTSGFAPDWMPPWS